MGFEDILDGPVLDGRMVHSHGLRSWEKIGNGCIHYVASGH